MLVRFWMFLVYIWANSFGNLGSVLDVSWTRPTESGTSSMGAAWHKHHYPVPGPSILTEQFPARQYWEPVLEFCFGQRMTCGWRQFSLKVPLLEI